MFSGQTVEFDQGTPGSVGLGLGLDGVIFVSYLYLNFLLYVQLT